jgi:hypothetical protein
VPPVIVTAAIVATFAVGAILAGAPFALLIRREAEGFVAAAADALVIGLIVIGLGASGFAWLGVVGLGAVILCWVSAVVGAVVTRSFRPQRSIVEPGRRGWIVAALWSAIIALALALRLHDVNFSPWIGDMGAYVNWANEFARTGVLNSTWPPLFPSFLAISSALFGSAHTAAPLAISGIALLAAIVRLLARMGVSPTVQLIAGLAVAVHPQLVWFSTFPGSESLAAPFTIAFFALVLEVVRVRGWRLVAAVALLALTVSALSLLRGSGPLLAVPLVIVILIALTVTRWRHLVAPLVLALGATALGASVGYWYGISEIRAYFVGNQIAGLLPRKIIEFVRDLGVFDATPLTFAGLAIGVSILLGGGTLLAARQMSGARAHELTIDPRVRNRWPRRIAIGIGATLLVGAALTVALGTLTGGMLLRLGPWYVVAAAAALAVIVGRLRSTASEIVVLAAALTAVMFIGLHTARLGFDRGHEFYLYWDRYLMSEALPCLLVLSAIGLDILLPALRARARTIGAIAATSALIVVAALPSLVLQSQDTFLRGSYALTSELHDIAQSSGPGVPVIWGADSTTPIATWPFQNTWMGFALPLRRTFGLDVVNSNMGRDNFGTDDVLDSAMIRGYLACRPGATTAIVFDVATGGVALDKRITDPGITVSPLDNAAATPSTLTQPPTDGWQHPRIAVTAWLVSVEVDASTPRAALCTPVPVSER